MLYRPLDVLFPLAALAMTGTAVLAFTQDTDSATRWGCVIVAAGCWLITGVLAMWRRS